MMTQHDATDLELLARLERIKSGDTTVEAHGLLRAAREGANAAELASMIETMFEGDLAAKHEAAAWLARRTGQSPDDRQAFRFGAGGAKRRTDQILRVPESP